MKLVVALFYIMKRSFWLLMFWPFFSVAQNYNAALVNDTLFYKYRNTSSGQFEITSMLPDSFEVSGADTIYHLYKIAYYHDTVWNCVDINKPAWMGKQIIYSNGFNYFINSNNDTIALKVDSDVGDSWILFKLNSGNYLEALCISADTMTVVSQIDTVKIFKLNAKDSLNNNVSHKFNNKEFIISKSNGLVKMYNILNFPNDTTTYKIVPDIQIPTVGEIFNFNIGDTLQYSQSTPAFGPGEKITIVYTDRVDLPDTIKYTYFKQVIDYIFVPSPPHIDSTCTNSVHYYSVSNLSDTIYKGIPGKSLINLQWNTEYFITNLTIIEDTFCNKIKNIFKINNEFTSLFYDTINNLYCTYDNLPSEWHYMINLGMTYSKYSYWDNVSLFTTTSGLFYFNTIFDTCGSLSYIVNVPEIPRSTGAINVYPNPFTDYITIQKYSDEEFEFQLFDMNGRKIFVENLSQKINRIDLNINLKPGIYFYMIINKDGYFSSGKIIK